MTRLPAERSGVQIPAVAKNLSLFQEAQAEIQTHSVSSPRGTGFLHLTAKRPGGEVEPPVSSGVGIKKEWR